MVTLEERIASGERRIRQREEDEAARSRAETRARHEAIDREWAGVLSVARDLLPADVRDYLMVMGDVDIFPATRPFVTLIPPDCLPVQVQVHFDDGSPTLHKWRTFDKMEVSTDFEFAPDAPYYVHHWANENPIYSYDDDLDEVLALAHHAYQRLQALQIQVDEQNAAYQQSIESQSENQPAPSEPADVADVFDWLKEAKAAWEETTADDHDTLVIQAALISIAEELRAMRLGA